MLNYNSNPRTYMLGPRHSSRSDRIRTVLSGCVDPASYIPKLQGEAQHIWFHLLHKFGNVACSWIYTTEGIEHKPIETYF